MEPSKAKKQKKLPQLKKNIKAFLTSEEGKVSEKGLLTAGIGLAMMSSVLAPSHQQINPLLRSGEGGGDGGFGIEVSFLG